MTSLHNDCFANYTPQCQSLLWQFILLRLTSPDFLTSANPLVLYQFHSISVHSKYSNMLLQWNSQTAHCQVGLGLHPMSPCDAPPVPSSAKRPTGHIWHLPRARWSRSTANSQDTTSTRHGKVVKIMGGGGSVGNRLLPAGKQKETGIIINNKKKQAPNIMKSSTPRRTSGDTCRVCLCISAAQTSRTGWASNPVPPTRSSRPAVQGMCLTTLGFAQKIHTIYSNM